MKKGGLSIIVPTWNEEDNVLLLVKRIDEALCAHKITYEIIFVDDNSTDKTQEQVHELEKEYPVKLFVKEGARGKAQSLLQGFTKAKFDTIAMIDADLQYPPEAIPEMFDKIFSEGGADVVIANRKARHVSMRRKILSRVFYLFFAQYLHGLHVDVQSGLKVFRKEVIERFTLHPSQWTFDLEFLTKAKNAGYTLDSVDIVFKKRHSGSPKIGLIMASLELGFNALKIKFRGSEIFPFNERLETTHGKGFHHRGTQFVHHTELSHTESAFYRLAHWQVWAGVSFIALLIVSAMLNWHATITIGVAILTLLYFGDLLFNFFLIYRSFSKPTELDIPEADIKKKKDTFWPKYTILCPLYKEEAVLPQFVSAMSRLDYPKNKLQILLLLEEDDIGTISVARKMNLPEYFEIMVVPHSNPKTKPKACNYGLIHSTGEYCTIYDAEDVPDPLQLKKAIMAFKQSDDRTICIQAKLNFYNPHQNLLTKVFTAEYSLWFDLVLTGLHSLNAPIPLGGTSNHFRTEDLKKLHGWDAFNVTEDCDLGMRLVKRGYRTAVINSTTYEEANSNFSNWIQQRTRWVKGYIQTYLVHMRNPKQFMNDWKEPHFVTFQLVIGGKVLSMFINPLMWTITILYFALRPIIGTFVESFFPTPVLYLAVFSLVFGNFLYMYYYMIGCAKRGYDDIIKYVFLVPFYWLAMSFTAWRAVIKIIQTPHYWSKTKHGLHLNNKKVMAHANSVVGYDVANTDDVIYPVEAA